MIYQYPADVVVRSDDTPDSAELKRRFNALLAVLRLQNMQLEEMRAQLIANRVLIEKRDEDDEADGDNPVVLPNPHVHVSDHGHTATQDQHEHTPGGHTHSMNAHTHGMSSHTHNYSHVPDHSHIEHDTYPTGGPVTGPGAPVLCDVAATTTVPAPTGTAAPSVADTLGPSASNTGYATPSITVVGFDGETEGVNLRVIGQ